LETVAAAAIVCCWWLLVNVKLLIHLGRLGEKQATRVKRHKAKTAKVIIDPIPFFFFKNTTTTNILTSSYTNFVIQTHLL
jgi:hypothetical protein